MKQESGSGRIDYVVETPEQAIEVLANMRDFYHRYGGFSAWDKALTMAIEGLRKEAGNNDNT